MGIALPERIIGKNAHEPTRWPIEELPSIPATGLNSKSLASAPTKAGRRPDGSMGLGTWARRSARHGPHRRSVWPAFGSEHRIGVGPKGCT